MINRGISQKISHQSPRLSRMIHSHFRKNIRITNISMYRVGLPLHEGSYKWSGGNEVIEFDATIVRISTNTGLEGFGECTPLGSAYLPAYADGVRAGIQVISPFLLGQDPTNLNVINQVMDRNLKGHSYVKSALDMACWDIMGKACGMPVCELLGGRFGLDYKLYRAISQDTPQNMANNVKSYIDQGYRIFQLKVGGDPHVDIERIRAVRKILDDETKALQKTESIFHMPLFCDANTGWKMHQALQVIQGVKDLDVYIEQPCLTYEECKSVRQHCPLPFIVDESMDDIGVMVKIISDKAADAVNLKISKVGGLTKAKTIRDLAVSAGIALNIEDTWGGDIVTAAISHLAHSTPSNLLLCSTDFNSYGPKSIAETTAHRRNGRMSAPLEPGLGVIPRFEVLGKPIYEI